MVVVAGSKRPEPGEEPVPIRGFNVGVPDGQPVYREGERDRGRRAHGRDGANLGRFPTPQDAADTEQAYEDNTPRPARGR